MSKVLIPLGMFTGLRDEKYLDPASYWYGPYEDCEIDAAMTELAQRISVQDNRFIVVDASIMTAKPSPLAKPEDQRREPGNMENYEKRDDNRFYCKECDSVILGGKVAHPISGSGECLYSSVAYCPNCDKKPKFHGEPVLQ